LYRGIIRVDGQANPAHGFVLDFEHETVTLI